MNFVQKLISEVVPFYINPVLIFYDLFFYFTTGMHQ